MRVRYSRRALSQLASLYEYLRDRNRTSAENVVAAIRQTIARVRLMPQLGRATDKVGVYVIIEPEYRYRVFYSIDARDIFIVRILHARQNLAK